MYNRVKATGHVAEQVEGLGPAPLVQLTESSRACVVIEATLSTHLTTTDLRLLAVLLSKSHDGVKAHLHSSLTSARHVWSQKQ